MRACVRVCVLMFGVSGEPGRRTGRHQGAEGQEDVVQRAASRGCDHRQDRQTEGAYVDHCRLLSLLVGYAPLLMAPATITFRR